MNEWENSMKKKKLPIVIDNYVKTECWTQLLLSIIQTGEYASAWIAAHIGIFGIEDLSCWYGNTTKTFSYRNALDILNFNEVDFLSIHPKDIITFLHNEIDNGNYVVLDNYVVLELIEEYETQNFTYIHEFLIFGYDDEKKLFYTSVFKKAINRFVEETITYDKMQGLYSNSFRHFGDPANAESFIYWSRNNYLISRVSLRDDYIPDGCEYDFLQNLIIEMNGAECTSVQYDNNRNVLLQERQYIGISCLIAAEKRLSVLLNDRHFIEKDTDIVYNDLLGRLANKLAADFYKLYEHRLIIMKSLYWFYSSTSVMQAPES